MMDERLQLFSADFDSVNEERSIVVAIFVVPFLFGMAPSLLVTTWLLSWWRRRHPTSLLTVLCGLLPAMTYGVVIYVTNISLKPFSGLGIAILIVVPVFQLCAGALFGAFVSAILALLKFLPLAAYKSRLIYAWSGLIAGFIIAYLLSKL